MAYIMNILDGHLISQDGSPASRDPKTYHRMAEAFKHAFAQRTKLADPRFEPQVNEVSNSVDSLPFRPIIYDVFCS